MVTTNSGKIVKYTYTERVLHAFSQVLKKHRRHAVHMTSLRAQVRKNAEANRDKLGPRWPNWVTKTVHRLEDEGILAPALSSGSVVMTPNGKKAISTVRKSLAAATNTSPTSVDQELIWKAIAHQSPTKSSAAAGVKRRRHSTFQPRNEDPEAQSSLARRNAKRARTSLPTVKKSLSKMTKAELQAAVRNLETENTDILMRPMSPLTDLDDAEERDRLEAELVARDEEIRRVRQQLDELKSQTTPVRSRELGSGQTTGSEATRDVSPSPEVQQQRPTDGVVRTQSGSLICDVSKRPTPAPSSPGVDGGLTLDEEEDLFGDSSEPVSPRTQLFGPALLAPLNAAAEKAKRTQEEMERVYRNKISILEEALDSRAREIQEQEQAREKLSEQIPRLEVQFADRISSLEQEIKTLGVRLSSVSSDLVSKDTELEHLRTSKDAVEILLKDLEEENSHARADLEYARLELTSAQDQNTSLSALHATAEATLATRDEEAAEMSKQLQQSLVECKSLEEQLASELCKNAVFEATLNESNASRDAKMTELSESLASSWEDNEGLRVNITNLESSVAKLKDELAVSASNYAVLVAAHEKKGEEFNILSERIQEAERSAVQQAEALTQAKADIDRLTQNLEQSKASEDTWRKALSRAEESYEKLAASSSAEVKQLQNLLNEAESRAMINEGKSAELENAVGTLHAELANAQEKTKEVESNLAVVQTQQSVERKSHESTVAEMKESLSTTRQQIDKLSTELKSARFERRRVQEDLVMCRKEFSDTTNALKAELAAVVSRANSTEEEISVLYRAKEADEKTIEVLKETFVQLRDAQLRSLEELGNKIHSAGSTPASKSHLTRMDL